MKKFNQLAKKRLLEIFLSGIKTQVAIKFLNFFFFFFFPKKLSLALKWLNTGNWNGNVLQGKINADVIF